MNYCRKKDVVARSVAGEILLVPVNGCTRKVFTLNPVGELLWVLIEKPRTADDLADALVERYHIARETASADVRAFLSAMVRMELVEKKDGL